MLSTWHGDFKDLPRRIAYDKVLRDKSYNVAKNPKHDGYHHGLASLVYKSFDKKSSGSGVKRKIIIRQELADQLLENSKHVKYANLLQIIFRVIN